MAILSNRVNRLHPKMTNLQEKIHALEKRKYNHQRQYQYQYQYPMEDIYEAPHVNYYHNSS